MTNDPFQPTGVVHLRRGREAVVRRRHPWVYRGALGDPIPAGGGPVEVRSSDDGRLGVALPGGSGGSLALRMVTLGDEIWNLSTLQQRLREAVGLRARLAIDSDAFRLVHAEGDRLPGLVIDTYAGWLVVEPYEPAWEAYLGEIVGFLSGRAGYRGALLRRGWVRDRQVTLVGGEEPPGTVVIREGSLRFPVDLRGGQKTGFFLDQRDNRRGFAALTADTTVLNLFAYSGGFAVAALAAGASRAINVDASAAALELARQAYVLNGFAVAGEDFLARDAFQLSRDLVADGARFDAVVVDPPAFVKRAADLRRGLAGYRDINLQAIRLLGSPGLLLTCSCSALVSEEDFGAALAAAALEARRDLRVLARWGAAPDHPVWLACPEPRHLQAWLCAVS